jgi:hypothetical protein
MAHLWVQVLRGEHAGHSTSGEWSVMPLPDGAFVLGAALLLRSRGADGESWLVMTAKGAGVRLNGVRLLTGFRVLADRDELCIDGVGRAFFSTERLATVAPFPGAERPVRCARCRSVLDPGKPSVRCPSCGALTHQTEDRPCWVYGEHCPQCSQPTALDFGFCWSPEGL